MNDKNINTTLTPKPKLRNWTLAMVFIFFLWPSGFPYFYMGCVGLGIFYWVGLALALLLLLGGESIFINIWLFIWGLVALIWFIRIACMDDQKEFDKTYNK